MTPLRLVIVGCAGRMGGRLISLVADAPDLELVGAVTEPGHAALGRDAAVIHGRPAMGVPATDDFQADCDVVIEFSTPAGCARWMQRCAERDTPIVSGTTGLDDPQRGHIETAARRTPVFWAPNMSLGASLLIRLASQAAAALGNEVEIEISETHHHDKIDAPSGTARALLASVCNVLGRDVQQAAVYGRSGQCGPRKPGEIGVHALRIGRTIGRHEIQLATDQETLTLKHSAHSRDAFAAGALRAARWLVGKPTGLYGMSDLLPIRS